MDPYLAMMGQPADDQQRQAMARLLREQGRAGGALSTSSIDTVADQGARMQESALGQAENIGLQKARQDRLNSEKEDRLLRRALEAQELANEEDDYGYKISPSERKEARTLTDNWRQQVSSLQSWDPSKQTQALGGAQGWLAERGLNVGSEADELQAWWAQFRQWENAARNDLFGSALTGPELRAWNATSINRSMDPSTVRKYIEARKPIIEARGAQRALTMMSEGHKPDALKSYFRKILPEGALDDKEKLRRFADEKDDQVSEVLKRFGSEKSTVKDATGTEIEVNADDIAAELARRRAGA